MSSSEGFDGPFLQGFHLEARTKNTTWRFRHLDADDVYFPQIMQLEKLAAFWRW